jgi:hypothetical protein
MEEHPNKFEWTLLIIFVMSAIGIFYFRVITPISEINQLATVLLSVFEILLALYIGYFLQRLDSIRQSRESLKKYGFLAYRRITDIKRSINRLFNEIARINKYLPEDKTNEVKLLRSILEGTYDTVESSILDWADIIGEEISKKDKIEKLKEELATGISQVNLSEEDKKNLDDIKKQLDRLTSEIPLSLKNNPINEATGMHYEAYFEDSAKRDGGITLFVRTFNDPSQEFIEEIFNKQPFTFFFTYERAEAIGCLILDKDKNAIGMIENPIVPYEKKNYIQALATVFWFLDADRQERSAPTYQFENLKFTGITNNGILTMQLPTEAGFAPWG